MKLKFTYLKKDYLNDSFITLKFINSVYYKKHYNKNRVLLLLLLKNLKERHRVNPFLATQLAVQSGKSNIEITEVQRSGRPYRVGAPIPPVRQISRFLKHITKNISAKKSSQTSTLLIDEISYIITHGKGFTQVLNESIYETSVSSLPFVHFRWR